MFFAGEPVIGIGASQQPETWARQSSKTFYAAPFVLHVRHAFLGLAIRTAQTPEARRLVKRSGLGISLEG